ncbi:cupin domain-containing protein [Phenylobacterium sp.]|uniref:cupin domain-containing protein n=1 Tax=Phenylobacterium sp. TaxID=1871053 RepID=UPI0025CDF832|nr:cupin domain-containing protein [Phenylobacterium sp.]
MPTRLFIAALSGALTLSGGAMAQETSAAWDPDHIAWQRTDPQGTRFALLEGVRDKAGVSFSYAFFIPAGVWNAPHSHSATARVFVARGVLRMGYGNVLDKASATAYPAGSYVLVPAGARHFDGSDQDTVIFGVAVGPWSTTYLDPKAAGSAGTIAPPVPGRSRAAR